MLQISNTGGATQVAFEPKSKLNIANVGQVKSELLATVRGENGSLIVDLSNLDYVDSSGIGAFLSLLRACREHSWKLTFRHPQQGRSVVYHRGDPTAFLSSLGLGKT